MKKVVFHTGSGKTGSSAIQAGLARYSVELKENQIYYPESIDSDSASLGLVTSGNANELLQYLHPSFQRKNFDEAIFLSNFEELLKSFNGEYLIFSNEQLELGNIEKWGVIFELIRNNGFEINVVYYVRSLVDHACSVYSQMVKRSCFSEDFDFYSNAYKPKFEVSLSKMLRLLPKSDIFVKIYEECKFDIFNDFLNTFSGVDFDFEKIEIVNRSLTALEISLLSKVNMQDQSKALSRKISDYLIYHHHPPKEPFYSTQQQINNILENNATSLAWVNGNFFDGAGRLKPFSEKVTVVESNSHYSTDDILSLCALVLCRNQ